MKLRGFEKEVFENDQKQEVKYLMRFLGGPGILGIQCCDILAI